MKSEKFKELIDFVSENVTTKMLLLVWVGTLIEAACKSSDISFDDLPEKIKKELTEEAISVITPLLKEMVDS